MRTFRSSLPAALAALSLLAAAPAWAQDEGDDKNEGWTDSEIVQPKTNATGAQAGDAAAGGFVWTQGTMGIATTFPTGGAGSAQLLWFLNGDTALDLQLGLNIRKVEVVDEQGEDGSETTVGLELGLGYRMLKSLSGRVRPYLEPEIYVASADLGEFSDTVVLGAGAAMGIELMVVDQFTLGSAIGGGLVASDSFDTIAFSLFTASIQAAFYWN